MKRVLNPHLRKFSSVLSIVHICYSPSQKCDHMKMLCVCVAYGGTLIEHSLMAVGLPGLMKVDGQFDVNRGKNHLEFKSVLLFKKEFKDTTLSITESPKILEALQMAEDFMEKTSNFSGKVRVCVRNGEEYIVMSQSLLFLFVYFQGLHHPEK